MAGPEDKARRDQDLEEIVTDFILRREEGEEPTIEGYMALHPRYAEELAVLLSNPEELTRWPTGRDDDSTFSIVIEPPRPLKSLGPYEILELVGAGGGGTVYRARHESEGHVVALKVLDHVAVSDPRDLERFTREAKMLRSMDLVNVVPVFAVGQDDGRHWIAMKWIEGSTLAGLRDGIASGESDPRVDRLRDLSERARLVARIARAFEAVHGYGVLHRDIKPLNILIDRLGEPMIIDFGIAKAPGLGEVTLTDDGPLGTPRYIAPELLQGGNAEVTVTTDVYGLGLCLYELVTETRAFVQQTRSDLFTQICSAGPLAPRRISPRIPHDLSAIILRSTDIKPERRYPSMNAFADDLDRFARGESLDPLTLRRAAPWRRALSRRWRAIAATTLLVVLVSSVAVWLVLRAARAAEIEDLRALIDPWFLAPPGVALVDGPALIEAAHQLAVMEVDPNVRLRAAWIPFVAGRWEDAVAALGPASGGEGDAARLLRAWLDHRVAWGLSGRTLTVSQNPELERPGVPLETEDVRAEFADWSREAELVRLRMRVPIPEDVVPVFKEFSEAPETAGATLLQMRATLRFMALPNSFVDKGRAVALLRPVLFDLKAAAEREDTGPWCRFMLAVLYMQHGKPSDARPLLDALEGAFPDGPEVRYLRALCHAAPEPGRPFDPERSSALFAAAADGMRLRSNALDRVPGDTALVDQAERKIYGHWALHELDRGRVQAAREVIGLWRSRFVVPPAALWRDRQHWHDSVFIRLIEARAHADADEYEQATDCFRAARRHLPGLALPLLEEARFHEDVMDDRRAARALISQIRDQKSFPRQAPRSVEEWLQAGCFGLRPYASEVLQTTVVRPPPKD